jgi:CDP-diacylglycerol--glycerol-3-phosphate 3-phosphatidyltransferase
MIAIPLTLTLARLALGPVAVGLADRDAPRPWFIFILIGGLLSDIFDGVLARRFGVATPWFRRLDSLVDVAFWLCILGSTILLEEATLRDAAVPIVLVLISEAVCVVLSLGKFRRLPATHCYSAKLYGLMLFVTFLGVLSFGWGAWAFWMLCAFGLLANLEVCMILLRAKEPPVDVKSVFQW